MGCIEAESRHTLLNAEFSGRTRRFYGFKASAACWLQDSRRWFDVAAPFLSVA